MSLLLTIDPGTRVAGCALFLDERLISAGLARNESKDGSGPRECADMAQAIVNWTEAQISMASPGQVVVEWPQIYSRGAGKSKADPNLLLPLVGVDCALAALLPHAEVAHYTPHEWKQNIKKPLNASGEVEYIITKRVKARLTPGESKCVDWTKSVKHSWDVADAIGIGLWHLGRFDRVRTFARE